MGKTERIPNFTWLTLNEPRNVTVNWKTSKGLQAYKAKLLIGKGM